MVIKTEYIPSCVTRRYLRTKRTKTLKAEAQQCSFLCNQNARPFTPLSLTIITSPAVFHFIVYYDFNHLPLIIIFCYFIVIFFIHVHCPRVSRKALLNTVIIIIISIMIMIIKTLPPADERPAF